MSKIVFFSIPAYGHTNPTLGVVSELVKRGHKVWYYSYMLFKEEIEKAGAIFVPCDEYDAELNLSQDDGGKLAKDIVLSTKVLVNTTIALGEKIAEDMKEIKPDCIVADSMALWGRLLAKKLEIPFVSSITTFAFSKELGKKMQEIQNRYEGKKPSLKDLISLFKANKEIKRLGKKGYKIKSSLEILANDKNTPSIVYTTRQFQPFSEGFNDNFAFVGPIVKKSGADTEKTKDILIYISMGSVNNNMPSFYKSCIDAFSDTEYQVIMSVGRLVSLDEFKNPPPNILVKEKVDQISVLEKADVFITHAGMNSVSEALYLGVPFIMLPKTPEQELVAERVLELGAGIRLDSFDSKAISDAVSKILSNSFYKENVLKISADFKNCHSAEAASEKILSVIKEAKM